MKFLFFWNHKERTLKIIMLKEFCIGSVTFTQKKKKCRTKVEKNSYLLARLYKAWGSILEDKVFVSTPYGESLMF